jgi:hypothetical protein
MKDAYCLNLAGEIAKPRQADTTAVQQGGAVRWRAQTNKADIHTNSLTRSQQHMNSKRSHSEEQTKRRPPCPASTKQRGWWQRRKASSTESSGRGQLDHESSPPDRAPRERATSTQSTHTNEQRAPAQKKRSTQKTPTSDRDQDNTQLSRSFQVLLKIHGKHTSGSPPPTAEKCVGIPGAAGYWIYVCRSPRSRSLRAGLPV